MSSIDLLRPPPPYDPRAAEYKDWLHLNVLDHGSGAVGLVNASVHGDPRDERSRAVGAALLHVPGEGWLGNLEVLGVDEAAVGGASVALEHVAVARDNERGRLLASADLPDDELRLEVTATPASRPLPVELPLPLGSGWISWYALPRIELSGTAIAAGRRLDLAGASGYHDHNWGRWRWGDDLGWEWGCFLAPAPGPAFVVARTTDREHERGSPPLLTVDVGPARRSFAGAAVELALDGMLEAEPRRLPGAMAALHQDRALPRLPARARVRADDGRDLVELEFHPRACVQIVAAEPASRGYGFLHELAGDFAYACRLGGSLLHGRGLAVFEYVC